MTMRATMAARVSSKRQLAAAAGGRHSRIDGELAALPVAIHAELPAIGARVATLAEAWAEATPRERHEALGHLFERVRLDVVAHALEVQPREWAAPYFEAARDYVRVEGGFTPPTGLKLVTDLLRGLRRGNCRSGLARFRSGVRRGSCRCARRAARACRLGGPRRAGARRGCACRACRGSH